MYFQEGALTNYVFIDPGWLCQDVLGKALAPGSFPVSRIASIGSSEIPVSVLEQTFAEHIDTEHIPIIIDLLQHFDLCRRLKTSGMLEFPALLSDKLNEKFWQKRPDFMYSGRRLICADNTDSFPPGFFCRLQVQVSSVLKHDEISLFKGSFLVVNDGFECLVKINDSSTAVDLIGRTISNVTTVCYQKLDQIHGILSKLIRETCPTIFLTLQIISAADLAMHADQPTCYPVGEVIAAASNDKDVVNHQTGCHEPAINLLYFGDETLQKGNSGKFTKLAYIPDDVIIKLQDLLQDGEKVSCTSALMRVR